MLELFSVPVKLLLTYGYSALFLWSILEGEIGLMLSGWLASEGAVFSYGESIAVAIAGATIGDFSLYLLGRLFSRNIGKWLQLHYRDKEREVERWVEEWGALVVVFERFIYGTHIPALLTVGMMRFGLAQFIFFDIIGIVLWAFTFVTIGFYFGHSAIHFILLAQRNILFLLFLVFLLVLYIRARKAERE